MGPEIMVTRGAMMNAHLDGEKNGLVEIDVDRGPRDIPDRRSRLLTAIAVGGRRTVTDAANETGDVLDARETFGQRRTPEKRDC